ncbi:N-acetylmuramic acid 6-phosphate etherase [bacterium BMS3Bbin06]|nr:N-acetylmuramic acid 6-phosphate etherase [bacterium BMS3Abin08]GBE35840.1 N-acetylmuramic acid 6-phosphate etherase [bacterium BMS3Bbin06]
MSTEDLNPRSEDIDSLSVGEIVTLMNEEDMAVVRAVGDVKESICRAVEDAIHAIRSGGGLIYIGAGTSGRLGVLDASEMYPTFGVSGITIRAIIAGGNDALLHPAEGAEDDGVSGRDAVSGLTEKDMLLGISASGMTPFVVSALKEGKRAGARCWLLTCNDIGHDFLDGLISIKTGAEVVAGSTRLKAGTVTKMVLNMISTATMIKLGRVYKGYMVDVVPASAKLKRRATRMVQAITGCPEADAVNCLNRSGWNPKLAVLMIMKGLDMDAAMMMLKQSEGILRKALK